MESFYSLQHVEPVIFWLVAGVELACLGGFAWAWFKIISTRERNAE